MNDAVEWLEEGYDVRPAMSAISCIRKHIKDEGVFWDLSVNDIRKIIDDAKVTTAYEYMEMFRDIQHNVGFYQVKEIAETTFDNPQTCYWNDEELDTTAGFYSLKDFNDSDYIMRQACP